MRTLKLTFFCINLFGIMPACSPGLTPATANNPPNIILILVDDMGWSDLGCYGGEIATPHIDRLAREGMRLTQFYNNAKCTTTRASLLTGLYPRRDSSDKYLLRQNMLTLGELAQIAGYQTALSGKWHLNLALDPARHPNNRGFDEYYGLLDGACNFFNPTQQDPPYKGSRIRNFRHNQTSITEFPEDYYTTDAFTDHAIQTIKEFSQTDAPFFLHLSYTAPHYPLHAKPEDIAKYQGKYLGGWDKLRKDRYRRQVAMGLLDSTQYALSGFDSRAYSWETADPEFEDLRMAVYAAMLDAVDQNIGRLMETLSEYELDENTLILFLSDNGGCAEEPGGRNPDERRPGPGDDYVAVGPAWGWAQNAPFRRYKVWMHEGGIRTPCIAWWPGHVPADTLTQEVGHIIDFMPTFAELVGVAYPDSFQGKALLPTEGKSLWPVLQGNTRPAHESLYWEYSGNRAIRLGGWKAVYDKLTSKWELFDLATDATEMYNLAEANPERLASMIQKWEAWAEKTGIHFKN